MTLVLPAPHIFHERDGTPLEDGYIYIGEAGLDARNNPILVYWDKALSQIAAQPIRTEGGYPTYQGAPSALYIAEDGCSVTVLNQYEQTVLSNVDGALGAGEIGFIQAGTGAVVRTALSKMRERVTVQDYGALGDGNADDTAAIQYAIDHAATIGATVYLPAGDYLVSGVTMKDGVSLEGDGRGVTTMQYYGGAGAPLLSCDAGAANLRVSGIAFVGDGGAAAISLLRFVDPGSNIEIDGCGFVDGMNRWAMRIELDGTISGLHITNNRFEHLPEGAIIVFADAGAGHSDIRINHNVFDDCGLNLCQLNYNSVTPAWDTYIGVEYCFNQVTNAQSDAIHAELWGCTGLKQIGNVIDGGTRGLSAGAWCDGNVLVGNVVRNQSIYFAEMGGPAKNVTIQGNIAIDCKNFVQLTYNAAGIAYENVLIEGNVRRGSGQASYDGGNPASFVKGLITSGYLRNFVVRDNLDISPEFNRNFVDMRSTQTDGEGYVEVSGNTCLYMTDDCPTPSIRLENHHNVVKDNVLIFAGNFDSGHYLWDFMTFIETRNLAAGTRQVIRGNRIEQRGTITGAGYIPGIGVSAAPAAFPGIEVRDNVLLGDFGVGAVVSIPATQGDTIVTGNDLTGVTSASLYSLNAAIVLKDTIRVFSGNAAPAAGTWRLGDTVMDESPVVGSPIGWKCTVAGTPGTWVALANL